MVGGPPKFCFPFSVLATRASRNLQRRSQTEPDQKNLEPRERVELSTCRLRNGLILSNLFPFNLNNVAAFVLFRAPSTVEGATEYATVFCCSFRCRSRYPRLLSLRVPRLYPVFISTVTLTGPMFPAAA
jgi:hypothetical protein